MLDVWGEGSVIDASDSHFTGSDSASPLTQHTITHADAADASLRFEAIRSSPGQRIERRLDSLISANSARAGEPTGTVYDPMPITSASFCADARQALQAEHEQTHFKQAAAALGYDITALPCGPEEVATQRIINFSANLDAPHDRHLLAREAKRQHTAPPSDP